MVDERVIQKLEHWINKLSKSLFVWKGTAGAGGTKQSKEGWEEQRAVGDQRWV